MPVKGPTALSFGADAAETEEHVSRKGPEIWLSPSPSTHTQYSIQRWIEKCPQEYLDGTANGHEPGQAKPDDLLNDEALCTSASTTEGDT